VPRFPQYFTQQVAQATDVVELISQYIALKKKGKEFVGLCPFHDDKNPSLTVSPAKQIFKCFACGAGGGVYQFLMLYEKLSFGEAVRTLAERNNIPLPSISSPPAEKGGFSKGDLVEVATFAARFFRDKLNGPEGADALDYARRRGLTDDSIKRFGLGYAPDAGWSRGGKVPVDATIGSGTA
jgi:DNA primase